MKGKEPLAGVSRVTQAGAGAPPMILRFLFTEKLLYPQVCACS